MLPVFCSPMQGAGAAGAGEPGLRVTEHGYTSAVCCWGGQDHGAAPTVG